MLERLLRFIAITLSLIVVLGFALFAIDDFGRASTEEVNRISGYTSVDPTPAGERDRERRHGKVREFIDDANDVVLRPFASVGSSSDSRWVRRGVPALLALLVYGVMLGFLARFMKARG